MDAGEDRLDHAPARRIVVAGADPAGPCPAVRPMRQDASAATQRMSDGELLERVRARDQRAFAELRGRHHAQVLARIVRVTLNPDLAEEVAQDLWLHLWQRPAAIDLDRGGVGTWLATVAHRRAVDCVRSVHAAHQRDVVHGLRQLHDVDFGPEEHGEIAWYRSHVAAALGQLSEYQRTAILLHHVGGLTHVEIARSLGIEAGAGRTRYRDGLRRLRLLLEDATGAPAGDPSAR